MLLTGALGRLLQASPSPRTGVGVAVLGVLTVTTVALATRLLLALTGRLPPRTETRPTTGRGPAYVIGPSERLVSPPAE